MKYRISLPLLLILLLTLGSCSFQKILKSGSTDEKYDEAIKLYHEKDYSHALQLFDQLINVVRATDKSQRIYYYYSYCYYNQKDYTLAAYYFKRYTNNYPNTPEAEECFYMSAYCLFMNSPIYTLDQTNTYEALKELQLFTNTYPTSKRVPECNELIDKLREKLAAKDMRIARMYYRMEDYAAAVQCFNNILKEYPETKDKEEILFMIIKTYYKYAKESIEDKKKDRYTKTVQAYNEFITQHPESEFLTEAKDLHGRSQKELESLYTREQKKLNHLNQEPIKATH
ncbi:MAG: outer membrane protein assembly factor BamD [Bacteroidetes bacterium]|nr:outer membrane protein assembly factor BamD [Bacteroidota bacterium]